MDLQKFFTSPDMGSTAGLVLLTGAGIICALSLLFLGVIMSQSLPEVQITGAKSLNFGQVLTPQSSSFPFLRSSPSLLSTSFSHILAPVCSTKEKFAAIANWFNEKDEQLTRRVDIQLSLLLGQAGISFFRFFLFVINFRFRNAEILCGIFMGFVIYHGLRNKTLLHDMGIKIYAVMEDVLNKYGRLLG